MLHLPIEKISFFYSISRLANLRGLNPHVLSIFIWLVLKELAEISLVEGVDSFLLAQAEGSGMPLEGCCKVLQDIDHIVTAGINVKFVWNSTAL